MRTILTSDMLQRHVAPEVLDDLPPDDPEAVKSRRDLDLLNRFMFSTRIADGLLRRHMTAPPRRILEIGAGDGRLALSLAGRLARDWPDVEITLLDRMAMLHEGIPDRLAALGWRARPVTADVFDWIDSGERYDVVSANLFLHHFDHAGLVRLFEGLRRMAPVLVATEPCRAAFPLKLSGILRFIGASPVTVVDAPASIRAGFTGDEISRCWRAAGGTVLEERRAGLFVHAFAGRAGGETP